MEQKEQRRRIFNRRVNQGLYAVRVGWDWSAFLIRHPNRLVPAFRLVVRELPRLHRTLARKANIVAERSEIQQQLSYCVGIFEEARDRYQPADLHALQLNAPWPCSKWLVLYLLLRAIKPQIVVETGVFSGESTSYILQALSDNGTGFLHSIDMPRAWYIQEDGLLHTETLPAGEQPGYLVPQELRSRWELILGRSSEKLPSLLEGLGEIDLFLHDSAHTYETMTFEFNCAWPHMKPRGFLVSDDAEWSEAFSDLALSKRVQPFVIGGVGYVQKV